MVEGMVEATLRQLADHELYEVFLRDDDLKRADAAFRILLDERGWRVRATA